MKPCTAPVVVGIVDKQPTALRFALREAHRLGTELRVIHAFGLPTYVAAEYGSAEIFDELRAAGQTVLDVARDFIEQEVTPVPVKYALSHAAPIEALMTEAGEACSVVIGADKLAWPDRLLGGAIATHVALHAPCPVVVVPERAYAPLSGGVVVALDGDSPTEGPLQFACEQASTRGHLVHVLHALPPATSAPAAEGIRARIGEILAGWSGKYPNMRFLTSFPIAEVDDACERASRISELVVVGRPHHRVLPYALARPVAAELIRHAHCPVAVVPDEFTGSSATTPTEGAS